MSRPLHTAAHAQTYTGRSSQRTVPATGLTIMARKSEAHHSAHPPGPKDSPHKGQYPWCRHDSATDYSRLRPTIRMRLTLLYGGMFLVAGIVLLFIIYFLTA